MQNWCRKSTAGPAGAGAQQPRRPVQRGRIRGVRQPRDALRVVGRPTTRIGANGNPFRRDPAPTPAQQRVIEEERPAIRRAINKIGKWLDWREEQ